MTRQFNPADSGYVEVPERIAEFRRLYPSGSLQSSILSLPDAFSGTFVAVEARAFRSPDDERPGVGMAWEKVPGSTPYTKDSELMNAETSAWGRAIVAVLAADAKRGIASAEEVRNRSEAVSAKAAATPRGRVTTASEHRSGAGAGTSAETLGKDPAPVASPTPEPRSEGDTSATTATASASAGAGLGGTSSPPGASPSEPSLETVIGVYGNKTRATFAARKMFGSTIASPDDLESLGPDDLKRLYAAKADA